MHQYLKKPKSFLGFQIFKKTKRKTRKNSEPIRWVLASDIGESIKKIVNALALSYIPLSRVKVFRSFGSKAFARARIWAFPRIWQQALNLPPHYIIEVLSEKFDHLSEDDKKKVLIHELMHIPKNFSGSLVSHRGRYHRINSRSVEKLFSIYQKSTTRI